MWDFFPVQEPTGAYFYLFFTAMSMDALEAFIKKA
jgi:hypothetical protein